MTWSPKGVSSSVACGEDLIGNSTTGAGWSLGTSSEMAVVERLDWELEHCIGGDWESDVCSVIEDNLFSLQCNSFDNLSKVYVV